MNMEVFFAAGLAAGFLADVLIPGKMGSDCLAAALKLVKPGTLYRDLGTAIEKVASANKCSVVRTYCGHGIGSLFHCGELSMCIAWSCCTGEKLVF